MKLLETGEADHDGLTVVDIEALAEAPALSNARLDVHCSGQCEPKSLLDHLARIGRITIGFSAFRDGRGFSLAQILRERGYTGELRATGDLIADNAPMLARCGFDSVELPQGAVKSEWERMLASFSAAYQPAADKIATIWSRRADKFLPRERQRTGEGDREAVEGATAPTAAGVPDDLAPSTSLRSAAAGPPPREASGFGGGTDLDTVVATLNAELRDAAPDVIIAAVLDRFPGRTAVLSSFGAEAAVSLQLVAARDASTPVLFLDTDRHFIPTLEYRDRLAKRLGLTDLRVLTPKAAETYDPKGDLWRTDADACCDLRKVRPLAEVAPAFDVMITGRKRFHGGGRLRLPVFERVGAQIRVNPLANWSAEQIEAHFVAHDLPRHPLVEGGYRSIGCWPCTQPSSNEDDVRGGRWSGLDKTECGIHMPERWVAAGERRRAS